MRLTGDTFVHNAFLLPQPLKCYDDRPLPLPGWPCSCHKKLVRWRMLRLGVGWVEMLLFLTGKDRPLATFCGHRPPSLPAHTH